ncbi:dual serine/threonine and tyrosine protein kinase-like isoform X1 [Lytechinus variegatus]|uniref:dual serine/threonine and tyrosine protein kinase-like isoform X1 n=1 Tax=Lytechinus variegatus TaxID=7654 RepID=UPI001BB1AE03|nr:dual serine/threonine and tyrosine protein kinase-like isoform X1 [Lytechinus variegatus]
MKFSKAESDADDAIKEEKYRTDEVKKEMTLQIEITSEKLTEKAKRLQDFEKIYFEMEQENTDLRSIQKKLEIDNRLTGDKMEEMKGNIGKTLEKNKELMIQLDSAHEECLEMERELKMKNEEHYSLQKHFRDITHENERLSNELKISSDKLIETSKSIQEFERRCFELEQGNVKLCSKQKTFHQMLIAAGLSTGLITSDKQEIDIGMIVQSYQELKERCSKLESQVEDGVISCIISPSDGQCGSELEALKFKISCQDIMITKLRYSLSTFQQSALSNKGSLETSDVPTVDRAVLSLIPPEEIPTVMESQLEPWDKDDTKAIGKGTFGVVFLKRLESDPVAVKVQGIHKGKKVNEDDAKRAMSLNHARTMKEVAVLRLLGEHQAFPRCHGYTKYTSFPGLVLEFLGDKDTRDVHSLSKAIKTKNPTLSDQEWLSVVVDITEGIHAMHERDLLHNDIKPNNILLHRNDRWKAYIIDMGNVTTVTMPHKNRNLTNHEMEGYRLGVVYQHLAPEYILDGEYSSIQSDIFSLGRIIHYISRVIHNSDLFNLATLMINSHPHLRPLWKDIIRVIKNKNQRACQ